MVVPDVSCVLFFCCWTIVVLSGAGSQANGSSIGVTPVWTVPLNDPPPEVAYPPTSSKLGAVMWDPPPAILPSTLDELTTIGVLVMLICPPPLALNASLDVGSRTRMPKSPADGLPTDTARARTVTLSVPHRELNPRVW